jgi:hypothetical protein
VYNRVKDGPSWCILHETLRLVHGSFLQEILAKSSRARISILEIFRIVFFLLSLFEYFKLKDSYLCRPRISAEIKYHRGRSPQFCRVCAFRTNPEKLRFFEVDKLALLSSLPTVCCEKHRILFYLTIIIRSLNYCSFMNFN